MGYIRAGKGHDCGTLHISAFFVRMGQFVMGNILLRDKQAGILIALMNTSQSWYISSLAKATGTTYVHACNFLAECEKLGLTLSEKHGKMKTIKLTEKGMRVVEHISDIYDAIRPSEPKEPEPAKGDDAKVKQPAQ